MIQERHQIILEKAKQNILQAQYQQKKYYDKKHSVPEIFRLGSVGSKERLYQEKEKRRNIG